mgnify:CR=1 FL=1
MKGFSYPGKSPVKQKYDLSKATVDGKHPQTEKNKKYENVGSVDLLMQGKTRDKDGNVKDIQWAPPPERPKYKKRPEAKKDSPAKQKPKKSTESAHGQLNDAEREYKRDVKATKRKKLDHIGKPYMRPPYKDTASGIRPYEKRQGYHGFKDFDSIIPQFQNKNKTKK